MKFESKKVRAGFALAALVLVVGAAGVVYASSGGGHGEGGSLSPAKLKDLGWRTMNFVALAIILVKFLGKPIANGLSSRRMGIMTQFEGLNERRDEVEKTYKRYEEKLSKIDQEVEAILAAAHSQAETEKERIIEEAKRAATDIKRKAELSVKHELAQAQKKLRTEIAEDAAKIAAELIRKSLTDTDQTKLVEDYLDKVGAL